MLRVGSFFATESEPCATFVFGGGNDPIYSATLHGDAFGDCGYARLTALAESGETVYLDSRQYTLRRLEIALRGEKYEIFSFEREEQGTSPSPISVISSYMKSSPAEQIYCLAPIFSYWQEFTLDTNVACISEDEENLGTSDKSCISPMAITCALSLACILVSSGDASRYVEVRAEKGEEDITFRVRAIGYDGNANPFVCKLLEDIGERCGFDVSLSREYGESEVKMTLMRAREASSSLSAGNIEDIHLALSLLSTMQTN